MSFRIRFLFVWLVALALSGCSPSDQSEEKEPNYALGISRVNAMDYSGAIAAFEASLEVNPHSAAAHYQLGMLYENQENDPAAAIYHYQQYLKYDPSAENADIIRQHIASCKQQLAAAVASLPSSSQAQEQLEKLVEQNRQLQQQVQSLQETLKQWNVWYQTQSAAKSNSTLPQDVTLAPEPGPGTSPQPQQPQPIHPIQPTPIRPTPLTPFHPEIPLAHGHTHVVEHGETAMAICRRFGIHLAELEAANPAVNLSHIRAGEVLNIP